MCASRFGTSPTRPIYWVNVALPWFNSIGQVVIPDFKTIPIPMWKGP